MEKLTIRNVGKTYQTIQEMNKQINKLNKKYEIMKENAETLAARIDKTIPILKAMKHCEILVEGKKKTNVDILLDILEGREE